MQWWTCPTARWRLRSTIWGRCRTGRWAVMVESAVVSDLTGAKCNAVTTHWTDDSFALANGTAHSIARSGRKTWFFLTSDSALGTATQRDATQAVLAEGEKRDRRRPPSTPRAGHVELHRAGDSVEGGRDRPGQRGRRHGQLDQRHGVVRADAGRAVAGRAAGIHQRRTRAGAAGDERVLAGQYVRGACVREPVPRRRGPPAKASLRRRWRGQVRR